MMKSKRNITFSSRRGYRDKKERKEEDGRNKGERDGMGERHPGEPEGWLVGCDH